MKKGEIYEGVIEKVEFPNKGYVNIDGEKVTRSVPAGWREDFWRFWRNHLLRCGNLSVTFSLPAEAVCIRPCLTKSS